MSVPKVPHAQPRPAFLLQPSPFHKPPVVTLAKQPENKEFHVKVNGRLVKFKGPPLIPLQTILKREWRMVERFAKGAFGEVYKAISIDTHETIAIKTETIDASVPFIGQELAVLRKVSGKQHMVDLLFSGHYAGKVKYIGMTLLGRNLAELKKASPNERLDISTGARMAVQMFEAIQTLHEAGYIHRDVKPQNFAIGFGHRSRTLHLIDFGLCRSYRSSSGTAWTRRPRCGFRGTVRYASTNIHIGRDMSRADDYHSALYILIELLLGKLPWHHLSDRTEVCKKKKEYPFERLTADLPEEMTRLARLVDCIGFYDDPHYEDMIECMNRMLYSSSGSWLDSFDWDTPAPTRSVSHRTVATAASIDRLPQASAQADSVREDAFAADGGGEGSSLVVRVGM